jgi:hypothetical protein
MGRAEDSTDRRRFERVDLPATALLLQRGLSVGRFTVQNLSAGGALLTGCHDVVRSAPLRVLLELPSGEALTVGAHVKRHARSGDLVALAVAFRHISEASEDRIQDAILALLDRTHRESHPAVIVVEPDAGARVELRNRARSLGHRVLTTEAPLGALRVLDDPDEHVAAVIGRIAMLELLEHVAESYDDVRPILVVDDPHADPSVAHPRVERCRPEHLRDRLR